MSLIPHNLLLAADAGGTKTAFRLLDPQGSTLAEARVAGVATLFPGQLDVSNILGQGIRQLAVPAEDISHCYFSLGGPNAAEVSAALQTLLPKTQITLEREGNGNMVLATAELLGCNAAVMVGTGSVAVGTHNGQRVYAGGWGPVLDDAGSGGNLGMTALKRLLKSLDGRCSAGQLTALFPQILKGLNPQIIEQRLEIKQRANGLTRKEMAAVVPQLVKQARQGEPVAREMLANTAREIAGLAAAVTPSLTSQGILACGGMFNIGEDFRQMCVQDLATIRPNCHWVFLDHADMIGCASVKLLRDIGFKESSVFFQHLGVTP